MLKLDTIQKKKKCACLQNVQAGHCKEEEEKEEEEGRGGGGGGGGGGQSL